MYANVYTTLWMKVWLDFAQRVNINLFIVKSSPFSLFLLLFIMLSAGLAVVASTQIPMAVIAVVCVHILKSI